MIEPTPPEHETESGYALAIDTAHVINERPSEDGSQTEALGGISALELYVHRSRKMIIVGQSNNIDVFLVCGNNKEIHFNAQIM